MNDDDDKTVLRSSHRPMPRTGTGTTGFYPTETHGGNVLPIGTHLGEFEIQGLIGEGGFGIVYLAYDHSLDRQVALKEYMPSGLAQRASDMSVAVRSAHYADTFNMGLKSFVGEARMLARFDSPSLVKVYRFWEENGTAYMVMPYYEGITLRQAVKDRLIEPDETWIRAMLANLLDAIDTIHRVQCYHRDIAPDNILLLKDGRPLLLDFGAARRVIGDMTQGLTVILKPGFAPIEQYADIPGLRQGPWTDMYALGAVVYYLITGKPPIAAVGRPLNDDLIPASVAGHGRYSDDLLATVDRMLAVRPENRVQSVAELRQLLGLEEGTRTMPQASRTARAIASTRTAQDEDGEWLKTLTADKREIPPKKAKSRLGVAVAGLALAAGIGGAVATYPQWWPGGGKEEMARGEQEQAQEPASDSASLAAVPPVVDPPQQPARTQAPPVESPAPPQPAIESSTSQSATNETPQAAPEIPAVVTAPAEPAPQAPAPASPAAPVAPVAPPVVRGVDRTEAAPSGQVAKPAPTAQSKDDEMWLAASSKDTRAAYEKYLKDNPRGKHAGAAKVMLDSIASRKAEQQAALTRKSNAAPEEKVDKEKQGQSQPPAVKADEKNASSPVAVAESKPAEKSQARDAGPGASSSGSSNASAGASGAGEQPQVALAAPSPAPKPEAKPDPKPEPEPEKPKQEAAPSPAETGVQRTIRYPGQTMVGNFTTDPASGVVTGTGRITWDNGDRYEGRLVRGIKEGKGTFIWSNGQQYSGEWSGDRPNGKGALKFADGNSYEGMVRDGQPHGYGTTRFKNGDIHSGNWTNGVLTGQAKITWASGDRYEGEVRNGEPHGRGTTRFRSGDTYAGEWVKGRHHGQGRYTWTSGSYWEGEYRDGHQTANGKHVMPDGRTQSVAAGGAGGGATLNSSGK